MSSVETACILKVPLSRLPMRLRDIREEVTRLTGPADRTVLTLAVRPNLAAGYFAFALGLVGHSVLPGCERGIAALRATWLCTRAWWQDSIVGALDLITARGLTAADDKDFVWRYVTSIALPTAKRLLGLLDNGHVRLKDSTAVDPADFPLVVTAAGFEPPRLHHTDRALLLDHSPADIRPLNHLDASLRVRLTPHRLPERIWAIGPTSWPRTASPNFLRTAAHQAESTAQQISGRGIR